MIKVGIVDGTGYTGEPFFDALPAKSHADVRSLRASHVCGITVQDTNPMVDFDATLALSQVPVLP